MHDCAIAIKFYWTAPGDSGGLLHCPGLYRSPWTCLWAPLWHRNWFLSSMAPFAMQYHWWPCQLAHRSPSQPKCTEKPHGCTHSHHLIKFIIPMALIQLEVLMVTLHKVSCLLASCPEKHLLAVPSPLLGGHPLRAIYPNKPLNAFNFFLDIWVSLWNG